MKKLLSMILITVLFFSFSSCGKGDSITDTSAGDLIETLKAVGNENSPDPCPSSDFLNFSTDNGEMSLEYNCSANIIAEGCSFYSFEKGTTDNFIPSSLPFGINIGMNYKDVCKAFSLTDGYAVFGEKGGKPKAYKLNEEFSVTDGSEGILIFGYNIDNGECNAFNSDMVTGILRGNVVSNTPFDMILFSIRFDSDGKLTSIYEIYTSYAMYRLIMDKKA